MEPQLEADPAAGATVRPRRRGRTALVIAAAVALGLVGGTAVGYAVQAERAPTPLPPLSQPRLSYPAEPLPKGQGAEPLSAKEDRRARTSGDLTKVLVPRPAGARESELAWLEDGWTGLDSYVLDFKSEGYMFESLAEGGFRRTASTSWTQGEHRRTTVRLVQFHPGPVLGAVEHAEGQLDYMDDPERGAGNEGDPIKGTADGRYFLYKVKNKPGYLPSYRARAIAYRGDVMLDVNIFDTQPISKKVIRTLAERQLERL
ncbi:hypothetical protein [Streptomyces sp. NPDC018833]|uniref:hypothetical protein n=1 Tax=Streptomyces sp. NPDC018833 TaxID=3365053 RepID=UPI0037AA9B82